MAPRKESMKMVLNIKITAMMENKTGYDNNDWKLAKL
jgi:hypothetical protein